MRFGTATLLGRSNVGKSTFLNAALGEALAIVSRRAQTTRDPLLGVVHRDGAQIAFIDTPGLHRPHSELGRRMNAAALEAARRAEVILFMTDVAHVAHPPRRDAALGAVPPAASLVHPEDAALLALIPPLTPCLLVVNKVDVLRDKAKLLPLLDGYAKLREFTEIVPISARRPDDVERVLTLAAAHLPEGAAGYDEDTLTDRPTSFFAREYVREAILQQLGREVPHAAAVAIDRIDDSPKTFVVKATIHVDKPGQRTILVGKGGGQIRAVGIAARERIEALVGKPVHLELFVRVSPRWRDVPRQLAELGYSAPESPGLTQLVADAPKQRTRRRS
ncbi:MAG: GTPase Era [Sorangiineae bacterium]|nr:GTPase Era [Polyangiaceae bacterium]MEB2321591.1 GTPase Era [Sorangiineae bacterium]